MPNYFEVVVLIVGDEHTNNKRDIIIEKQTGRLKRINELHPAYLPLQYPLLYPKGEDGYRPFVLLGSSQISWKTKKQHTVSRSSTKVEYRSMTTVTRELKWLKDLLHSLGIYHSQLMRLHCDSQATLHIVKNPVFHECIKHI